MQLLFLLPQLCVLLGSCSWHNAAARMLQVVGEPALRIERILKDEAETDASLFS
jgi:hypothetical protein